MEGPLLENYSQSDYSNASLSSLGRSVQIDDNSESSYLLAGSIQTVPFRRQPQPPGSTWFMSVFLVVNAALGAGLLNFPASYHACGGIVVAITVQSVLAFFVVVSMIILIYCAQVHQSTTYQDVVYACCGRSIRILCSVIVALYAFGTCVTFFIIIGDQWDKFLSLVYGMTYCHHWYMSRQFTISISAVIFVLPMCFPRRIDFLKYTSIVGAFAVLYCVVLVTVKYFTLTRDDLKCPLRHRPDTWMSVFTVVPVICFGYQCHLSLVPIYACTSKKTLSDFSKTILVALVLCFLTYTVTASLGYLTFGSCILDDILSSYSPTPEVLLAVIVIGIKMYTTYPILLFVGRAAVDSVWTDFRKLSVLDVERNEKQRRIVLTVVWFLASLLIAIFVPDIGKVIALLGSLAAIFIFVFPGMCLLQLILDGYVDPDVCWLRYAAYVFISATSIVFGVFLFGITATQSLMDDFAPTYGHKSPSGSGNVCVI